MASIRKRGKKFYFRGTIPSRQADGTIRRIRHEEVLQASSRARAAKEADDLARYYWDIAYHPPKRPSITFAKAALIYIETRGKSDRFIDKLVEHFGETPLDEIDQAKAIEAAKVLYPSWSGTSLNRAIFTPLSAIGIKGLERPAQTKSVLSVPNEGWFDSVISAAPPKLAALIVFLTLTGRRVGEALALTEGSIDESGNAHIPKTKTNTPVVVRVPLLCLQLLHDPDGYYDRKGVGQPSKRLFGYASLQAASVALRRTCERAKVPYFSFHKCGRHSFATRGLKAGKSLKWIKEAAGWASMSSMFRYLHLEQTEVDREKEELGKEWAKARKIGDK